MFYINNALAISGPGSTDDMIPNFVTKKPACVEWPVKKVRKNQKSLSDKIKILFCSANLRRKQWKRWSRRLGARSCPRTCAPPPTASSPPGPRWVSGCLVVMNFLWSDTDSLKLQFRNPVIKLAFWLHWPLSGGIRLYVPAAGQWEARLTRLVQWEIKAILGTHAYDRILFIFVALVHCVWLSGHPYSHHLNDPCPIWNICSHNLQNTVFGPNSYFSLAHNLDDLTRNLIIIIYSKRTINTHIVWFRFARMRLAPCWCPPRARPATWSRWRSAAWRPCSCPGSSRGPSASKCQGRSA